MFKVIIDIARHTLDETDKDLRMVGSLPFTPFVGLELGIPDPDGSWNMSLPGLKLDGVTWLGNHFYATADASVDKMDTPEMFKQAFGELGWECESVESWDSRIV